MNLFNAHLNRKRDDTLLAADRLALASALHAELQIIRETLVNNAKRLIDNPPSKSGGFVVPKPAINILPQQIPRIGLLRIETIHKVMSAYSLIEGFFGTLILLGGELQTNVPYGREMVYLDAQYAKTVSEISQKRAAAVEEAIDALIPYLE